MAVADDGLTFPVSSGAIKTPTDPVVVGQVADPSSTGAVAGPPESVTTKFGPSGQKPSGAVETPGPETFENPVVAKVVRSHHRREPSTATAETKTQRAAPVNEFEGR